MARYSLHFTLFTLMLLVRRAPSLLPAATRSFSATSSLFSTFPPSAPDTPLPPSNDHTALSRQPFNSPRSSPDDSTSDSSWSALSLIPSLSDPLLNPKSGPSILSPTPIQTLAIPPQLAGSSVAFAAATGSGKTLAYLLPLFQTLKTSEIARPTTTAPPKSKRPRAIILAPTRELCVQIFAVLKSLSHSCKLSSTLVVGGEDYGIQRRSLDRVIDIVVATPGRLLKHKLDKNCFLGSVETIIIDETDTMIESGFAADLSALCHPLLYDKGTEPTRVPRETAPQFVMTTATMTVGVRRLLDPTNPEFKKRRAGDENEAVLHLPGNIISLQVRQGPTRTSERADRSESAYRSEHTHLASHPPLSLLLC